MEKKKKTSRWLPVAWATFLRGCFFAFYAPGELRWHNRAPFACERTATVLRKSQTVSRTCLQLYILRNRLPFILWRRGECAVSLSGRLISSRVFEGAMFAVAWGESRLSSCSPSFVWQSCAMVSPHLWVQQIAYSLARRCFLFTNAIAASALAYRCLNLIAVVAN